MPVRKNNIAPHTSYRYARRGLTLIELVVVVAILVVLAGFIIPLAGDQIDKSKRVATNANLVLIRNAIMGTEGSPGFYSDTGLLPGTLTDLFNNPFASLPSTDPNYSLRQFNRDTGRGWRGPYIIPHGGQYAVNNATNFFAYTNGVGIYPGTGYGLNGEPAILDAWGHPIVLQIPNQSASVGTYPTAIAADLQFARLISAGPNGTIDTPQNATDPLNNNPYPLTTTRGDDIVLFVQHSDSNP